MGSITVLMAFGIQNLVEPTYTGQHMNWRKCTSCVPHTTGGQLILDKSGVAEPCADKSSVAVGYPGTSKQAASSGPSDVLGRIDEQDHCVGVVSAPWSCRGAC